MRKEGAVNLTLSGYTEGQGETSSNLPNVFVLMDDRTGTRWWWWGDSKETNTAYIYKE